MKAIANPIHVEFAVILFAGEIGMSGHVIVRLDWGEGNDRDEKRTLLPGMTARYMPVVGDYLVRLADGYEYVNPRDVFQRKYRKADGDEW